MRSTQTLSNSVFGELLTFFTTTLPNFLKQTALPFVIKQVRALFSWIFGNKTLTWLITSVVFGIFSIMNEAWPTFILSFLSAIAAGITLADKWKAVTSWCSDHYEQAYQKSPLLMFSVTMFGVSLFFFSFGLKTVAEILCLIGMPGIMYSMFGGFATQVNQWNRINRIADERSARNGKNK